jgi:hypothetical protein
MIRRSFKERTVWVWSKDPAIDEQHPEFNWDEFKKSFDLKHVPFKSAEKPTKFHCQPLPRMAFERMMSMPEGPEMFREMVAFGVTKIENFEVDGADLVVTRTRALKMERLDDATLDKIFDPFLFAELAGHILEISKIRP